MTDISFKVVPHSSRAGQEIVEIHSKMAGGVIGVIYPQQENVPGIKVVSAHIVDSQAEKDFAGEVIIDDGSTKFPHIPSVHVVFRPSSWSLTQTGHVLKPSRN